MERSPEKFIEDRKIARYADQLKMESDPLKQRVLLELLSKEEAKRENHIGPREK